MYVANDWFSMVHFDCFIYYDNTRSRSPWNSNFLFPKAHTVVLHSLLICSFLILSFLTLEIYCTYKIMCLPLCKKMWKFLFPLLLFFFNTLCPWMKWTILNELWPPKRGSGLFCLIKVISQNISLCWFIL